MNHARLLIHELSVDAAPVAVSMATLVVVRRAGMDALDWEVVAATVGDVTPEPGRNDLGLVVVSGADAAGVPELSELRGAAAVVRWVDSTIVWRGDSPLDGFDEAWLAPS